MEVLGAGAEVISTSSLTPSAIPILGLMTGMCLTVRAQHSHLNAGALEPIAGSKLYFANGANFITGAKVLWDGVALPTTFVNGNQVTAQVAIGATGQPQSVGVAVLNPDPDGQSSNTAFFTVQQQAQNTSTSVFLPLIQR